MGNNTWTTSDLISDIKLLGHVPEGNSTFTPANLIRLAQMEIQTPIAKQILSSRGGYYLTYADYPIVDSGLYDIPAGCVAGALANVELVQEPTIIPVNQLEESEQFSTNSPTTTSYGFFMRGNYVQILPIPNIGVARLWYFKRTNDLILTSQAGQINLIDILNLTVSVNFVPTNFIVGSSMDFCGDQPPFNVFGTQIITAINGTDITLDALPDEISVGDWLCLEGQTPVPQIPVEYRLPLTQRVVCKIYELQGYNDKLAAAQKKLKEYEENAMNMITPRVKSQTKIVNPVNGGFMSGSRNRLTNFPAGRT